MSRIFALGLTALVLAACKPAVQPPVPAEPVVLAARVPEGGYVADPAWTAEEDRYLAVNVQPADPIDAVIWRGVRCNFLAGEFGGDNSAQDRAVNARMDELRCGDELLAEARALRVANAGDPTKVARLDALLGLDED